MSNKSIIVEVDDATKNVMQDIQSGVNESIAGIVDDVKSVKSDIEQSTDSIMQKLRGLNSLDDTIDQLRKVSQESIKLTDMVSPLNDNLNDTENHILEQIDSLKKDLSVVEGSVTEIKANVVTIMAFAEKLEELQSHMNKIDEKLSTTSSQLFDIVNQQTLSNNESFEKIMLLLNIIKNLVTPFWKRKKNED